MTALVVDPADVAAIAAAIARAPLVAFDLEFLSQERLVPVLCLIQVAWPRPQPEQRGAHDDLDAAGGAAGSPAIALIDPIAVDAAPVVAAIAAHGCAVAHAARQDLQLLATRYGASVGGLIDTQVMAAFAGLGDQVGLAALAAEVVGAAISKDLQWTDWAQRPLTAAQLAYAADDVRHLPAIHAELVARLGERVAWARAESAAVVRDAEAAARVTAETAWQQVGARGLDPASFAALVELAAWRHRTAVELDRPLGQVLNDRALGELARKRPASADGVRAIKQLSPIAKQRAGAIAAAISEAPPRGAPVAAPAAWRAPSVRAQRWADALVAIAQLVAEEARVAARLLATRADAEELARAVDERGLEAAEELPALATWRRELVGVRWLGWLSGRLALVGDPASAVGVALVEVRPEVP